MTSNQKNKLKKVCIVIIITLLIFSIISFAATAVVYQLIFDRYEAPPTTLPPSLQSTVASRREEQYLSGENQLTGFLYRSKAPKDQDTLIVIAAGFHACADDYLWQIKELLERGWSVFAFDATGHCHSQGDSSVGFPQEVYDLKATLDHIEKNNRFGYNDLVLMGHSRGGYGVCAVLAYDYDVAAVVSVSGINSAMEGVIGSAAEYVGPFAWGNYGFLWLYQALLFDTEVLQLRADEAISASDVPVLLIHGEEDEKVPCKQYSIVSHREDIREEKVEYLFRSAPDNAGHTDLLFDEDGTANDEVIQEIHEFLMRYKGEF